MTKTALLLFAVVICAGAQNNDQPPAQPFQAVHLIKVTSPAGEKTLAAAMADMNAAIAKAGCPKCAYHLWKVTGTQAGDYNYLWTSNWPGRDVYVKVHSSAGYQAALKKHPEVDEISKTQIYNRYVEVKAAK